MRRYSISRFSSLDEEDIRQLGTRRFGLTGYSQPGTLQSCMAMVEDPLNVAIAATRSPLVAADRSARITGAGGYLAGRAYALPDVSGGVAVEFEEVYPLD